MARSSVARSQSLGDLVCTAERLNAVLITIDHATDPGKDLADDLTGGDLQLGLIYELMPLALRMSRQLIADLERAEEDYERRSDLGAA